MKLPVEERMQKITQAEYYDYQIHSHLINEFRTQEGKFCKIDLNKLTEYEKLVVWDAVDEFKRNVGLEVLGISGRSNDYKQFFRRRYLNELIGVCLAMTANE